MKALMLAAAVLPVCGCVVPVTVFIEPAPVVWRLVDAEAEAGRRLYLEREEPRPPRIEVRLSRDRAVAGEVVEAELWLSEGTGRRRIEVRPSRPDVTILGPVEFEIAGVERVVVRFSGASPGRGGIVVLEKE